MAQPTRPLLPLLLGQAVMPPMPAVLLAHPPASKSRSRTSLQANARWAAAVEPCSSRQGNSERHPGPENPERRQDLPQPRAALLVLPSGKSNQVGTTRRDGTVITVLPFPGLIILGTLPRRRRSTLTSCGCLGSLTLIVRAIIRKKQWRAYDPAL